MPPRKKAAQPLSAEEAAATAQAADPFAALAAINSPVDDVLQACRELGIKNDVAMGMINRLAARRTGYQSNIATLTTKGLISKIEEKIALVLNYLDEFAISGASPKDLAIIFGIMVEKRQLLLGEPTQILSTNERKHLNELIVPLMEEARARGMMIDLTPANYSEVNSEGRAVRVLNDPERPPERKASMLARKGKK